MMTDLMYIGYEAGVTGNLWPWMLATAAKGGLVLSVALCISIGLRRSSAARRHLVWTLGAVGLLLIPIGSAVLPQLRIPLPASLSLTPIDSSDSESPVGALATPTPRETAPSNAVWAPGPPTFQESSAAEASPPATPLTDPSSEAPSFSEQTATAERPTKPQWALPLLGIWFVGLVAVMTTLITARARVSRLEAKATRTLTGPLHASLMKVARTIGISRVPTLLQGDDTTVPMTWGITRPRVILPSGAESWAPARIEAVLLHELGHIARRDCLAQAIALTACALHWFNPLAWYAARRMRVEREHACDDLVISFGLERASYAHDLVDLARSLRPARIEAAALCLTRPNTLRDRLVALMDDTRDRRPVSAALTGAAVAVAFAVALPLAALSTSAPAQSDLEITAAEGAVLSTVDLQPQPPSAPPAVTIELTTSGPAQAPSTPDIATPNLRDGASQEAVSLCGPRDGESIRQIHSTSDGVTSVEAEFGECQSSVRIEGDIEFSEDFSTIERLSGNAFLRLEVTRDGELRRIEVRPGPGGRPEFEWRVGRTDLPFDTEAERWLEGALLDLFRSTSYKANERAAWLLGRDGVEGVLEEVEHMMSGHVQARYLTALLEEGNLTQEQLGRVFQSAREHVDSDHALGEVLATAAEHYTFDANTRGMFIETAGTLESDHQQAQAFSAALQRSDLSPEDLQLLLRSAQQGLESDHQMAEILVSLAEKYSLQPATRGAFLDAAATLESDHQQARVYGIVLARSDLDTQELATVIDAAATMESDHQLAELLVQAADQDLTDPTLREAFLRATRSIESDHNRAQVLRRGLQISGLTDEDMAEILSSASTIDSDHQLAEVLSQIAVTRPLGAASRQTYLETAASIDSDHQLATTLTAFVALDLAPAEVANTLDLAAREVESDHQLAELLLEVSGRFPVEGQVREAFVRALDTIESEHQHGRVASSIVN